MNIIHSIVCQYLEVITIDGHTTYIVDRHREELRNIHDPSVTIPLAQRQSGRTAAGDLEVLERYHGDDGGLSIVLDASPCWLESLKAQSAVN
jgi:hypothetical protein